MRVSLNSLNPAGFTHRLLRKFRSGWAVRAVLTGTISIILFTVFVFYQNDILSRSKTADIPYNHPETSDQFSNPGWPTEGVGDYSSEREDAGEVHGSEARSNEESFKVTGHVVYANVRDRSAFLTVTMLDPYKRIISNRLISEKFRISVPKGEYRFEVIDRQSGEGIYRPLIVNEDTSIWFMFSGRRHRSVSAKLQASLTTVLMGKPTVLYWSTENAYNAKIDKDIGTVPVRGSIEVYPVQNPTIYTLKAYDAKGGHDSSSVSITVNPVDNQCKPAPKARLEASPRHIKPGTRTTLIWSTENADSSRIDHGIGAVEPKGRLVVDPQSTTTYRLTASNPPCSASDTANVTVGIAPPDDDEKSVYGCMGFGNPPRCGFNGPPDFPLIPVPPDFPAWQVYYPLPPFPSKAFQLIMAGLFALGLLGLLAWSYSYLSTIPSSLSKFFGGFGMAGQTSADGDEVHCTLYSPPEVNAGTDLLVQVFAHLLEQEDQLDELATELDPDARKAISKALRQKVKRESVLTFKLMVPGIDLDEEEQDVIWCGEPEGVEFIVSIPADQAPGNRFGRVFVYNDGKEIGKIPFRISIVPMAKQIEPEAAKPEVAGVLTKDPTAFVSYASRDKDKVYRFVKLMDILKYKFHMDIFNLEPGERWEQKLYEFIGTDDVFLLFWSEAASQSEWVVKEAKLAKERLEKENLPQIVIYELDGKTVKPEWLNDIHVDRKWAEMIGNIDAQQ